MALDAGVHTLRVAAGAGGIGTGVADGAGLGGECVDFLPFGPDHGLYLTGDGLVLFSGGQGGRDVGDVVYLRHGADKEYVGISQALGPAEFHSTHGWRAGPGFPIHLAFVLADPPDPVRKG